MTVKTVLQAPHYARRAATALLIAACVAAATAPAFAQTAPAATGAMSGRVASADGLPLAAADVNLDGPTKGHVQTDANGAFSFGALVPGLYRITVAKASYASAVRADVAVVAGTSIQLSIDMQLATFSSLKEIGRVSTARGASAINTSTAAVIDVPAQVFTDQGQTSVTKVLNETPGIVTTNVNFGFNDNSAYASFIQEPQIRGALSYETESLIDGHPISVGSSGYYSPLYINPHMLEGVELVKGPGSMPTTITNAIGGTVNYRTLEPTRAFHGSVDFDYSSYGGLSSNFQATGTTPNGRLGYAFDYGVVGQPGPIKNQRAYAGTLDQGGTTMINGQPICGTLPAFYCTGGLGPPPPANVYNGLTLAYPILECCDNLNSTYDNHTELVKLRYNFSPQTSLTAAYLGATAFQTLWLSYQFPQQYFGPPAGYSGSLPVGFQAPYAISAFNPSNERNQQGLFETELRTAVGKNTLLLRYYTGAQQDYEYNYPSNETYSWTAHVWGGLPLGPGGAIQYFNGQLETFTQQNGATGQLTDDHFSGYSGEFDIPSGNNLYTVSVDRTHHDSYSDFSGSILVPIGASQAFTTFLLRGSFLLSPQLTALFGNYFISYSSHYTPDGGLTWADASRTFYGPRLALTYQPAAGTSLRFSAGSSIAPPFLSLINTAGGPPFGNNQGAPTYYIQTKNNGNIDPETAFGWDFGVDRRVARDTILSGDVYQTNLHGQFLNSTQAAGTYTATSGLNVGKTLPLFVSTTSNLGQSRFEGIELSLRKTPTVGFGYTAQGALLRGYTYNLPPGFYDTGAGPNTTNLGVIPNANFFASGNGYNGVSDGRLPYSQGYGEINYRTHGNALFLLGATYYGSNNPFNAPAFVIVSATARVQVGKRTSLQITGDNLTNQLSAIAPALFDGMPVPLVNGLFGTTQKGNYGPATFHLILHHDIGR